LALWLPLPFNSSNSIFSDILAICRT
jgi:hypothetical protein